MIVEIIAKGISLPASTYFIQIKQHCVDISENMSMHLHLSGSHDFYFICFKQQIFENDRSLVLAGVTSLKRLCINVYNQSIFEVIDLNIHKRMSDLMLVSDEEVVAMILEYFYQYSKIGDKCSLRIIQSIPQNIVKVSQIHFSSRLDFIDLL